jgi:hypothetical protein
MRMKFTELWWDDEREGELMSKIFGVSVWF